ncbi:hypothetical protein HDU76_000316 [Blyttiomyces sp. JEL0837]|nr:hypothetical protein HDU76_000316 [Blyttiomyces sp. JEL0837]
MSYFSFLNPLTWTWLSYFNIFRWWTLVTANLPTLSLPSLSLPSLSYISPLYYFYSASSSVPSTPSIEGASKLASEAISSAATTALDAIKKGAGADSASDSSFFSSFTSAIPTPSTLLGFLPSSNYFFNPNSSLNASNILDLSLISAHWNNGTALLWENSAFVAELVRSLNPTGFMINSFGITYWIYVVLVAVLSTIFTIGISVYGFWTLWRVWNRSYPRVTFSEGDEAFSTMMIWLSQNRDRLRGEPRYRVKSSSKVDPRVPQSVNNNRNQSSSSQKTITNGNGNGKMTHSTTSAQFSSSTSQRDDSKKPFELYPDSGTYLVWNKGRRFTIKIMDDVSRQQVTSSKTGGSGANVGNGTKVLTVSCFAWSTGPLTEFVRYCVDDVHAKETVGWVPLYSCDQGEWKKISSRSRRPLDSVILADDVKDNIVNDVRNFFKARSWYQDSGIPHRRHYLFHGPSGTGKTSLALALASDLGVGISVINLSSTTITDATLCQAVNSAPTPIVLLEDIDGLNTDVVTSTTTSGSLSFAGIAACLDGLFSEEGRIVILTSQELSPSDLPSALMRPGRVDYPLAFNYADESMVKEACERYVSPLVLRQIDDFPGRFVNALRTGQDIDDEDAIDGYSAVDEVDGVVETAEDGQTKEPETIVKSEDGQQQQQTITTTTAQDAPVTDDQPKSQEPATGEVESSKKIPRRPQLLNIEDFELSMAHLQGFFVARKNMDAFELLKEAAFLGASYRGDLDDDLDMDFRSPSLGAGGSRRVRDKSVDVGFGRNSTPSPSRGRRSALSPTPGAPSKSIPSYMMPTAAALATVSYPQNAFGGGSGSNAGRVNSTTSATIKGNNVQDKMAKLAKEGVK